MPQNLFLQQAISARERALCQLTVYLSFRVEVKEEKDTQVVPYKWYSYLNAIVFKLQLIYNSEDLKIAIAQLYYDL